jgi:hypothetical protein
VGEGAKHICGGMIEGMKGVLRLAAAGVEYEIVWNNFIAFTHRTIYYKMSESILLYKSLHLLSMGANLVPSS